MSIFLCYDLKGIQQYIFQVPRLKCCIGGSRQIDNFDRKEVVEEKGHLSAPMRMSAKNWKVNSSQKHGNSD